MYWELLSQISLSCYKKSTNNYGKKLIYFYSRFLINKNITFAVYKEYLCIGYFYDLELSLIALRALYSF